MLFAPRRTRMGRILCLRLFILLPTPRFALSVLRVNKTVVLLTRKNWTRMGPAWEHHHVCKKKQIAVRILRLRLFILLPTPSSLSPSLSPSLSLYFPFSLFPVPVQFLFLSCVEQEHGHGKGQE